MTWKPAEILSSLAGDWLIQRSISDIHSSAMIATLEGTARFTLQGAVDAAYAEEGMLALASSSPVSARRAYYYRQREDGLDIFFDAERERLFHRLAFRAEPDGSLAAADSHLCVADHYRSLYRFLPDGGFTVEHVVTGPHKSYRSTTLYRR